MIVSLDLNNFDFRRCSCFAIDTVFFWMNRSIKFKLLNQLKDLQQRLHQYLAYRPWIWKTWNIMKTKIECDLMF